jgi:nucleotide-binding universal stress UspA family protein
LGEEPYREIVDEASERNADLIVLRRRGKHSYFANLLLGEMVHTVTGHTHCDVLSVPRASQLWSRSIVLATDGSPHSERATKVAAALSLRHGLPLTVVSVAEQHIGHAHDADAADANVERALAVVRATGREASVPAHGEGGSLCVVDHPGNARQRSRFAAHEILQPLPLSLLPGG